jgi:hypothetical protein
LERSKAELKRNSAVDALLIVHQQVVAAGKMNQPCLIKVLYKKFEESFASIDIELNLVVVQKRRLM